MCPISLNQYTFYSPLHFRLAKSSCLIVPSEMSSSDFLRYSNVVSLGY
jgi:hypothetical protein